MAAWVARLGRSELVHVGELLDRAESLVVQMIGQQEHAAHLRGEIATLPSFWPTKRPLIPNA